jgi:hypothetical protein
MDIITNYQKLSKRGRLLPGTARTCDMTIRSRRGFFAKITGFLGAIFSPSREPDSIARLVQSAGIIKASRISTVSVSRFDLKS